MILKKFFLVVFVFLFTTCKKDPSLFDITNLNNNQISVLGHGGMGISYRYPMNSMESLIECLNLGTSGTEMDVCVTKDSIMVLCHSQNLEDNTKCKGLIKEMNWSEIKNCNYGYPIFSKKVNIIEASAFFDAVENKNNLLFVFDCKIVLDDKLEYLNLFAESLLKLIDKYNLDSNCFIESFNTSFLEILQSKNKDLHLFVNTQDVETGIDISRTIHLFGLTLDTKNVTDQDIEMAHNNNLRVALFNTQTERENIDAVLKNPDYIQTDKVDYLVNALK
ncbi:glycerophosphodiester phosphodiesterase [Aurantibacillus circumpalustris]|uniref:glycerophosphodiester phosphodiesterase n=1 Tax=Aurantibacillus circumpalustris TaxID=3036359 RepID=UPI00295BB609|nr:glycerophosphodiester phosphodiesterase family protein [Aurantibacillus circumpalustris]